MTILVRYKRKLVYEYKYYVKTNFTNIYEAQFYYGAYACTMYVRTAFTNVRASFTILLNIILRCDLFCTM
jgi:hypothetical protein